MSDKLISSTERGSHCTIIELQNENEILKDLLSQFITKSNGLSKYVRADWVSVNSHHREVGERINDLYELQCDAEEILGEL